MAPETSTNSAVKDLRQDTPPKFSAKPASKTPIIITIILFIVIIAAFIGIAIYLFTHPDVASVLRDISIILLSMGTLLIALLAMMLVVTLVYLSLKIADLVELLRYHIIPFLEKANDTADIANQTVRTVQSRVTVVSEEAVKPVVNVLSTVSAAKAVVKTLFKRP